MVDRSVAGIVAVALLALLIAAPARADGYAGCDADGPAIIAAAYDEAETRTWRALNHLAREPDGDLARRWFGTAPRREVRRALKATLVGLRPGRRPPTDCGDRASCSAGRFAYARMDLRRVYLCPAFFAAPDLMGQDSRFGILVHEVSHLFARTRDAAYGPGPSMRLAQDRPHAAAVNADNIEYFVEGVPGPPVVKALPAR